MDVRAMWEEEYNTPSIGNPLFEGVPLVAHQIHLIAKHLHRGGGVTVSDDKISLTKKPESATDTGGKNWPQYQGDSEIDTYERRVAVGLDPNDDGQPEPGV
jgi:hypothetical protein